MVSSKLQDLPPEGGYNKIPFARIPARAYFSGYQLIAGKLKLKKSTFCNKFLFHRAWFRS
jgi:hypothetical protein